MTSSVAALASAVNAGRPLLLGHRGHRLGLLARHRRSRRPTAVDAEALAEIENTLPAFDRALEAGCDGLELDIHITADRQLVIHHDPLLSGLPIELSTLRQLRRVQPLLPMLPVVLRRYARRAWLDLEIKAAGLELEFLECLRKDPPQRGYVVSSFLPGVLCKLAELAPEVPLCLNLSRPRGVRLIKRLPVSYVAPDTRFATRWYIEQLQKAGWKVLVWTVNRERKMRMLAKAGVTAVVSDNPALLVATLGRKIN
jgi:glycerophosphoryl diester phosphodiesterase